jgi:hypothetical protein
VLADHEEAARQEALEHAAGDLALPLLVEVGEEEVAAEDAVEEDPVEGAGRHLAAQVLEDELDARTKMRPQAEEIARRLEGGGEPLPRCLAETARLIAGADGALQKVGIGVGAEHGERGLREGSRSPRSQRIRAV